MFDIREWIFFVSACTHLMPFNKKYQTKSYSLYSKLGKVPFEMKVQREVDRNVQAFASYFDKIYQKLAPLFHNDRDYFGLKINLYDLHLWMYVVSWYTI